MVEYNSKLDVVFGSLSDPTRRDILKRISKRNMSVGEIAHYYTLSFAAVAKHLDVLQRAGLISKHRQGKEQIVSIAPKSLAAANDYLENYRQHWESRLSRLGILLEVENKEVKKTRLRSPPSSRLLEMKKPRARKEPII